ncbi:Filamin-B-like [Oopsacas minuta]|uniref:Filamin-B-like n=1 Tax=Oopsacas minuta TaxID=111878 RepID=A0AAV7KM35_9METZ|nr:Filamin-B-like [Oopsacas minuta]
MSGTYEISLSSPKRSTYNIKKASSLKSIDVNILHERKVLTLWVNHMLEVPIESSDTLDFTDGICLIRLVDKLTRGYKTLLQHTSPVLQCQKLDNYKNMLSFLRAQTTAQISPKMNAEGFLFGDLDMQYELVWQLVKSYKLRASEYSILKWVNKLVVQRNVRNFTEDWADGIVLYSFVNSIIKGNNPDCICPRDVLPQDLLKMTLDTASDVKNIPVILTPYFPLHLYPTSKSLLTYLSLFISPYIANIKRWLHNILPLKKFCDFNSCWSDGHLLSLLLEKVCPGICKDIVMSYSHKELPANMQLNNLRELLNRSKKSLNIKTNLEPISIANRTAEPLSLAIFLDDIRRYSLIKRPSRKLAVQTSDYDTASMDSSTNSVSRTISEMSMGFVVPPIQRRRSKSYDSLNRFGDEHLQDIPIRFNTDITEPHRNSFRGGNSFERNSCQRLSSNSIEKGRNPDLTTNMTYSLESYIDENSKADVGIREIPIEGNGQNPFQLQVVKKEGTNKKRHSKTRCCVISLLLSLIIILLLLIMAAGSVIVVCMVGQHCTPKSN